MARVLSPKGRRARLQAVAQLVNPTASTILDLGSGIGAVIPHLIQRSPMAQIIAVDQSAFLLQKQQTQTGAQKRSLVQSHIPELPFRNGLFDVVVAIQFLHEIFCFLGPDALRITLKRIYDLLDTGGSLVVLDHQNPGSAAIKAHLPEKVYPKLQYFIDRFQPREIHIEELGNGWIRTSMRDFYDFITKLFALGTPLEEEEMHEEHTPFLRADFVKMLEATGFHISHNTGFTPIELHLKRFKVKVETSSPLPKRHLLVRGTKIG
jgi:ubiquinone/menaquinone biosynthesis C-methylase UbiE